LYGGYEVWRLRLFSFCGYGLALAALALLVFGAYDSYPKILNTVEIVYNETGYNEQPDITSKFGAEVWSRI